MTAQRAGVYRRASGFTLVELLVVVGIIAILVAILLPSLAMARERAKKTACAANLKQLHLVYHYYADTYGGHIPLGYGSTVKQFNYAVSVNDQSTGGWKIYYSVMGPLYVSDLITTATAKAFFCPANTYPSHIYNYWSTDGNACPWPPIRTIVTGPSGNIKCTTRFGYGCRPMKSFNFNEGAVALGGGVYDINWPTTAGLVLLPKLADVRFQSILADIVSSPERVDRGHNSGVNVLYGDGSAHYVTRKSFDADLKQIPSPEVGFSASYNNAILNDSDSDASKWTGVWVDLDKQF